MPAHQETYDVVVAGGGAGGVGAAIGAAQAGARVVLIEKYGFLGGAATNAQVLAYCGFFQHGNAPVKAVAGAGDQVLREMRKLNVDCEPYHSPTTGNWIILLDPERLKIALDQILAAHKIDVMLHTRVAAAERTGRAIEYLTVAGMDGQFPIQGGGFVDATGDAELALVSDVPMRLGDGEARLQAFSMPIRVGGVAPETIIDRAKMCASIDLFNRRSPFRINRTDGGIYTRIPSSGDLWWLVIDREMPDLSWKSFTHAEQSARRMALCLVDALRESVPGFENAWLAQTGPQIGVRETRHPAARFEILGTDVVGGVWRDDGVARGAWPIELHSDAGKPTYEHIGGRGFYHVPLAALQSATLDNLFYAGRVIGADFRAYGSTRVMGTALATGEAAGVAAALTARRGIGPDADAVREVLIATGALI